MSISCNSCSGGLGTLYSQAYAKTAQGTKGAGADAESSTTQGVKPNGQALSADEVQTLLQLRSRDQEVRSHEAAHLAAAGSLASGSAHFNYQVGPDGQNYAIGGDVGIDISAVSNDPAATLSKAAQIRRAALAPIQPSSQDMSVVAQASQMAAQALSALQQQTNNNRTGYENSTTPSDKGRFINVHA